MLTLTIAARRTEPDWPNCFMVTLAAAKQAKAEPRVFTKYSRPTDRPTLFDTRTMCSTNNGNVQPISMVGTRIRSSVTMLVLTRELPAVNWATQ